MQNTAKCTVIRQASVSMASVRIASYLLKSTAPEMSGCGQLYTQEPPSRTSCFRCEVNECLSGIIMSDFFRLLILVLPFSLRLSSVPRREQEAHSNNRSLSSPPPASPAPYELPHMDRLIEHDSLSIPSNLACRRRRRSASRALHADDGRRNGLSYCER
jgi:hypothetical protein